MLVRGQEHLQRELLVPPVHAQPTVTTPLRCRSFVVAMQGHVDHWASTKGHTKEETQACRALLLFWKVPYACVYPQQHAHARQCTLLPTPVHAEPGDVGPCISSPNPDQRIMRLITVMQSRNPSTNVTKPGTLRNSQSLPDLWPKLKTPPNPARCAGVFLCTPPTRPGN